MEEFKRDDSKLDNEKKNHVISNFRFSDEFRLFKRSELVWMQWLWVVSVFSDVDNHRSNFNSRKQWGILKKG